MAYKCKPSGFPTKKQPLVLMQNEKLAVKEDVFLKAFSRII